jgi:alkylhydroperoxidase family enzyme
MAGLIYATIVEDAQLAVEMRMLTSRGKVPDSQVEEVVKFARGGGPPSGLDARSRAALSLARAASPSPAVVSTQVIDECRTSALPAPAIVELISWISVLQMLHRILAFYPLS